MNDAETRLYEAITGRLQDYCIDRDWQKLREREMAWEAMEVVRPLLVAQDKEIDRLQGLVAEHHNVSRTGHFAQLGRVCPVCRELDPETRAALGLGSQPADKETTT